MANGSTEYTPPRADVGRPTYLLREILQVSDEFETHVGQELAVNPTDLQAMQHLITSGPLGPTVLARRLGISTAAVTAVVDRLVAVGHATRTQHPTDRRGIVVVPNPASVARAMGALMPMIMGIDGVLEEFDDEEQATITAYLERVLEVYRAQLPD
ncbi:MarR family transcriptional regulator [soil metagenome]